MDRLLGVFAREGRWFTQWLEAIPDITFGPEAPARWCKANARGDLRQMLAFQYSLGGVAYQIQHKIGMPKTQAEMVAVHQAALESVLSAYVCLRDKRPENRSQKMDEALALRDKGELSSFVNSLFSKRSTTPTPLDAAERKEVVEDLANTLEAHFVFPETGARYAAMLRSNLAKGGYDRISDPSAFAEKVTADLQAVARDRHLKLDLMNSWEAKLGGGPGQGSGSGAGSGRSDLGLQDARMIGDVAYLRFNLFPDGPETAGKVRQFLIRHADAKAVIIDSRENHGGTTDVIDAMMPFFYARPTTLVRMEYRSGLELPPKAPTMVRRPSPPEVVRFDHVVTPDPSETRFRTVKIFYLTSHRTASAAEHLALAFKRTGRATLIGETTAGAGHFGGLKPIGNQFAAFIPMGRTYDPDTLWDWEGVGVKPDVEVPADQALEEALRRVRP